MGEIIRTWLRTRLGVIIDLSPDVFGHYARDGTLLAKILYSYDVINENQFRTLNRTQDPALSRVNLKNLRIWLRFIGVECDDDCTDDISNGKGTSALRLFYKVFLALENKDSLHFITLQKEREKYLPNSEKFDVATVVEEPNCRRFEDDSLAEPLRKAGSLIEWQRKKYDDIVEGCKRDREKFRSSFGQNEISMSNREKNIANGSKFVVGDTESKELDEFARKHKVEGVKEYLEPCEEITKFQTEQIKFNRGDENAAEAYTKFLKRKYRREAMTKSFKTKMQKALLSQVWDRVVNDQEMELDELIARKVLNQSQYEKKMMRKLCDVRNEKARMAANRQIVEELSQRTKEREGRLEEERAREVLVRENEEVEAERMRMKELERRINEDVLRRNQRKLRKIGENVVNDIVDISVMTAEHKIATNVANVPTTLRNRWMALFAKGQPIVGSPDADIRPEVDDRDSDEEETSESENEADLDKTNVLNDEDFDDYHNLRSPWNDFLAGVDSEDDETMKIGLVVVGYIVHKVLRSVDPRWEQPAKRPLPKMEIRSTVLGVPDNLLYEPIRRLLNHSGLRLVCMEDAINYCLERYKTEMKDREYIDLNIVAATRLNPTRQSSGSAGGRSKKWPTKGGKPVSNGAKSVSSEKRSDLTTKGIDKVTQTPRVIPWEDTDPILTDSAYIGKWIHEFLTLGQPLSDDLNARILLEYLKSLTDVRGFVVVNYPTNYEQMTRLEFALTSRRLPNDRYETGKEEMNIEDIESRPSRISFEDDERNSSDFPRSSRLVPDPLASHEASDVDSYFTSFVAIKPKPVNLEKNDADAYEVLPPDGTSLEAFYVDQGIASIFYYTTFDFPTLKRLARLVITGENSIPRISSAELFGEAIERYDLRNSGNQFAVKAPIVKKLLSRTSVSSSVGNEISEWSGTTVSKDVEVTTIERSPERPPRPGDLEWSWADLPQPRELVRGLADLWRALEKSYVENLKDAFHLKRLNFEAMIPYANFVKTHMKEVIERPDAKQDLLHEFHRAFNDVDNDLREDIEVRHELHCRVADFEMLMWDICNDRRKEAEDERKRIILNHWTTREAIVLANVYVTIIQAEFDRFADGLQFVQDYYLAMLERPLQDVRRSRMALEKIPVKSHEFGSNVDVPAMSSTRSPKETRVKDVRGQPNGVKTSPPPSCASATLFEEEIGRLLMDVDREIIDSTKTICYKTVESDIQYVRTIVESMAGSVNDILKKEETSAAKLPTLPKEIKGSSRKPSRSSRVEPESSKKRAQDLVLEWRYAIAYEINRILTRLKILDAAATSDVHFLLDNMQRLFFGIHESLVERYKNEVKSVNLMTSTFRFAIEEAVPIQEEMLLDGDRFLVRSNVLMYPNDNSPDAQPIREDGSPGNFEMAQLGRLLDIFRRVAPSGTLAERSFVYILQDLIVCGDEEAGRASLPPSWRELRACDVATVVNDVFGDVQFVDWREFIIHAMDIETPSVDQLIRALSGFRNIDLDSTDTVTLKEFHSVGLWFFDWNLTDDVYSRPQFRDNFETEDNEENEETFGHFFSPPKKILESAKYFGNDEVVKPESIMRLTLAKELLCEMYTCESERVNYMALLLDFCKDEDPKEGLAKALSLAIGEKICTDGKKCEEYEERLTEMRRRAAEDEKHRKYLREEAIMTSEEILNDVLRNIFRNNEIDAERVSIPIKRFDEPRKFINSKTSLDDRTSISSLADSDGSVTPEDIENKFSTVTAKRTEHFDDTEVEDAEVREPVYWLNIEVCQAVLAATLPRLAAQPDILETTKSLRENLKLVWLECRNDELNDDVEEILVHRFFEHSFVNKLINATKKFTTGHLTDTVNRIIRENK